MGGACLGGGSGALARWLLQGRGGASERGWVQAHPTPLPISRLLPVLDPRSYSVTMSCHCSLPACTSSGGQPPPSQALTTVTALTCSSTR